MLYTQTSDKTLIQTEIDEIHKRAAAIQRKLAARLKRGTAFGVNLSFQ
jgi:hypothetical protein